MTKDFLFLDGPVFLLFFLDLFVFWNALIGPLEEIKETLSELIHHDLDERFKYLSAVTWLCECKSVARVAAYQGGLDATSIATDTSSGVLMHRCTGAIGLLHLRSQALAMFCCCPRKEGTGARSRSNLVPHLGAQVLTRERDDESST